MTTGGRSESAKGPRTSSHHPGTTPTDGHDAADASNLSVPSDPLGALLPDRTGLLPLRPLALHHLVALADADSGVGEADHRDHHDEDPEDPDPPVEQLHRLPGLLHRDEEC